MLLLLAIAVLSSPLNAALVSQPGYGYVGPACAVVDGQLFVHGVVKRHLSSTEVEIFQLYQSDISRYRDGLRSNNFLAMDAPIVPGFCGGYDDSTEIVLNTCIVRNNHVYINEKLIRALTNREKQKLETAVVRRNMFSLHSRRIKREMRSLTSPQRDFSSLIHRLLNVNSTVTSRFLPVVSQSPLFSLDGAFNSVLAAETPLKVQQNKFETTTPESTTASQPYPATEETTQSTIPSSRSPKFIYNRNNPDRVEESSTPKLIKKIHSYNENFKQVPRDVKPTKVSTVFPKEETVSDPVILQLIARALANNEILDNIELQETLGTSKIIRKPKANRKETKSKHPKDTEERKTAWYTASEIYTSTTPAPYTIRTDNHSTVPSRARTTLPDEICTAHLINRK